MVGTSNQSVRVCLKNGPMLPLLQDVPHPPTEMDILGVYPSGKLTFSYGKSPFSMGKSTINGHVQ